MTFGGRVSTCQAHSARYTAHRINSRAGIYLSYDTKSSMLGRVPLR